MLRELVIAPGDPSEMDTRDASRAGGVVIKRHNSFIAMLAE